MSRRKTDNGGCIKYNNKYYKFYKDDGSQVVPKPKTNCLIIKKFDGQLICLINQFAYILEEFQIHREDSILELPVKKERKVYRPPLSHPFKEQSYLNYLKNYRPNMQNNYSYNIA